MRLSELEINKIIKTFEIVKPKIFKIIIVKKSYYDYIKTYFINRVSLKSTFVLV